MYSPQMAAGGGYYVKTTEDGGGGPAGQHIGSLNPNFLAGGGKSSDGQNSGFYYANNTVPTHPANGERGERLFTENYGQMQAHQSPMLTNHHASNDGGKMGGKRIYFGGNVSMQSSNNDGVSCMSPGDQPYAGQMCIVTNKLKDGGSLRGLSD